MTSGKGTNPYVYDSVGLFSYAIKRGRQQYFAHETHACTEEIYCVETGIGKLKVEFGAISKFKKRRPPKKGQTIDGDARWDFRQPSKPTGMVHILELGTDVSPGDKNYAW